MSLRIKILVFLNWRNPGERLTALSHNGWLFSLSSGLRNRRHLRIWFGRMKFYEIQQIFYLTQKKHFCFLEFAETCGMVNRFVALFWIVICKQRWCAGNVWSIEQMWQFFGIYPIARHWRTLCFVFSGKSILRFCLFWLAALVVAHTWEGDSRVGLPQTKKRNFVFPRNEETF